MMLENRAYPLDESLRRHALADDKPMSWAIGHLACALRLLHKAREHVGAATIEDRGLQIAIDTVLLTLSADPPETQAELIERLEAERT